MNDEDVRPAAAGPPTGPAAAAIPGTAPEVVPDPLPVPTDRVVVAFAGEGAGVAELSWGQREIWLAMLRQGWLRMGGTLPLGAEATLDGIADELAYMMGRFPTLRTRLRFDAAGRPSQELFAAGEIGLEVYDTPDDEDPSALASAVEARYLTTPRDFVAEWPLRMGVVRHRKAPTHLVVITCHLVTDGAGAAVLSREMRERPTAPVAGTQMLELARWQQSPAGRRQSANSLRHLEKALRSVVPRRLPASADPREPRHWTGELTSPALNAAVRAISERTGADSSSVLLALYAIAVSRRGLLRPAVIRLLSGNRFRPGLANVVGNLVQSGICVLDVVDTTVDEVVRRAQHAALAAYKNSYFDPDDELALIDRIAREHGPGAERWSPHTWSFFNDRRTDRRGEEGSPPVTRDRLRELLDATSFRWVEKKANPYEPLFLHIEQTPDSLLVIVSADTHHVSPADNEGLTRDMEELGVRAAFDADVPIAGRRLHSSRRP
ncbi:MAG: condensation domain-containing protein [Catenulispora sp.]